MNILAKYTINREHLKNGDIIIFRGNDIIDKAIQFADKAYFNHIGIIWQVEDRYLICDATGGRGVNIDFLSTRMRQETDFCVLRTKLDEPKIKWSLKAALALGDNGFGYNYLFIIQIAISKLFKIDIKKMTNERAYICSAFVQYYTNLLGVKEYINNKLITPQDYYRSKDQNVELVIDREYKV